MQKRHFDFGKYGRDDRGLSKCAPSLKHTGQSDDQLPEFKKFEPSRPLTSSKGNTMALKNAAGLYSERLRASYKCGLSLRVSFRVEGCSKSARTRPRTTPSRYTRACGGFIFEMNIRVAACVACGDHCSGEVRARMRAHAGREGMILNGFGSGPAR